MASGLQTTMASPTETTTATYFAGLAAGKPIRYGMTASKGKALFATKSFGPGEPLFHEMPFVSMQHIPNQSLVQGCENCHVIVGSIEQQLAHVLHVEVGAVPPLPNQLVGKVPVNGKCTCACGAIYCSPTCRSAAWERYHCALCTGHPDTPMHDFLQHAIDTNEIFLLAAQVLGRICVAYAKDQDLAAARRPVDMFCKLPWWEVVASEEDLEEGQSMDEYCGVFRHLLEETFALFMDGLRFNVAHLALHEPHPDEASDYMSGLHWENVVADGIANGFLSVDFFANVVGMFEMNNISMEVRHPLSLLAERYEDSGDAEIAAWLDVVEAQVRVQVKMHMDDDDDDDDDGHEEEEEDDIMYPDLDGTALFSLVCTMNHSCEPNVAVCYESNGLATVVALAPIATGDELCIAYIETEQDVEARTHDLREYKFECQCPRCLRER
ncbi:hypothetical protein SPRG_13134 [Saprolegnia parasitica CBS 223.65]|uniref:SET domain-containing protein n=1 Tax=Saprolegnia parasitica (strain CBS 223.65) TaxID=695850 RepID=A0A067BU02_SAPPC|nr:hypothetical protein SPRG_13134 [Saprolegnia parasitica CBS 223.65]KDO21718.1 hypothetical protein SPRG_13134 [Saprolegnia parasitica CBS 223.65]|eukprot:XP_012207521.1 hypothetical protein SPRG_13134 [Saprolegnia parasitica CBS 223.65]